MGVEFAVNLEKKMFYFSNFEFAVLFICVCIIGFGVGITFGPFYAAGLIAVLLFILAASLEGRNPNEPGDSYDDIRFTCFAICALFVLVAIIVLVALYIGNTYAILYFVFCRAIRRLFGRYSE